MAELLKRELNVETKLVEGDRGEFTVWVAGRCTSWYLDRTGRNSSLWPDFTWRFRRRMNRLVRRDWVSDSTVPDAT